MIKSKEGRTKGRVKVVEAINNEIPEVAVAPDKTNSEDCSTDKTISNFITVLLPLLLQIVQG